LVKQSLNTKRKHYVNNKQLLENILVYKEKCTRLGRELDIPSNIALDIMKISDHLSYSYQFINYSYRDEMIADGIMSCVQGFGNFDPEKSTNPFAYFTMICFNAFVNRINKEQKQHYLKHKNVYNVMNGELLAEIQSSQKSTDGVSLVDSSDRVIEQYEEKVRKAKEKQNGISKQTVSSPTDSA